MFKATDYATTELHVETVTIDGEDRQVHIRELPATDLYRYFGWLVSDDEDVRAAAMARLVARGVCGADGESLATWEEIAGMRMSVIEPLGRAVLRLNGFRPDGSKIQAASKKKA